MTDLLARTIARIQPLDQAAMRAAEALQLQLTKPPRALGRLESLSVQLAGITGERTSHARAQGGGRHGRRPRRRRRRRVGVSRRGDARAWC